MQRGYWVPRFDRRQSAGTARLRVSLSASHTRRRRRAADALAALARIQRNGIAVSAQLRVESSGRVRRSCCSTDGRCIPASGVS